MSHEVQSMKIFGALSIMLFCEQTEPPERRRNKVAAPKHLGRFIIVPLDLMMGGENVEYNNDKAMEVQLCVFNIKWTNRVPLGSFIRSSLVRNAGTYRVQLTTPLQANRRLNLAFNHIKLLQIFIQGAFQKLMLIINTINDK